MTRVAINGFGRIGRRFFRLALEKKYDFEIVAINDLTSTDTLAHLLKYDSVHGRFSGDVEVRGSDLVVNGKVIKIIAERDPANLPWGEMDIDVVVECTGIFTKREAAGKHLEAGGKRVVISAPATDPDITVCIGINDDQITSDHRIISNASCTTNCLAPLVKVLHENFGLSHGLMTTIHSYTNDQQILDLPHKDLRRARAAAVNMIPTSTGAAKAIGLVMPEMAGKLNGYAVRVPTPNVSLVDLTAELKSPTTAEAVNAAFSAAANGALKGVLAYVDEPLVSIDFNGDGHSSSLDADLTLVMSDTTVKVVSWYDNETGYSNRVADLVALLNN